MTARKHNRPVGQATRGKTAPNRLRQTDVYLAVAHADLIRSTRGLYVDLGYGAFPVTTLETWQRLRRLNPGLRVVGVEIDPDRVTEAAPYARPGLEFRLGGFNLPLAPGESAAVVRAFNVLRQYAESEVDEALALLGAGLGEGGLLLEGTCDPAGRLLNFVSHIKQQGTLAKDSFVFAPRLSAWGPGFQPRDFRAVLPKAFIHHAEQGSDIDLFFACWHKAWQYARARAGGDTRQTFTLAALRLADHYGYGVDRRRTLLRRGFLRLDARWPKAGAAVR